MLTVFQSFILCAIRAILKICLKSAGLAEKSYSEVYEESTHLHKIWMRAKIEDCLSASKDDFLVSFDSYTHPRYVLKDNVTLYCLTPSEALFVETPEGHNIFDCSDNSFLYDAQYKHAYRLITMPLATFHQLANEIGDPGAPVILLSNSGRCGGNLLLQIAETIPGTVCIGEPDGLTSATMLRLMKVYSDDNLGGILKSCIRMVCKAHTQEVKLFVIKSRFYCIQLVRYIVKTLPSVHHLYVYRESLRNVQSFERAHSSIPYACLAAKLRTLPVIGRFAEKMWVFNRATYFLSATEGPYGWCRQDEYFKQLSPLGNWCVSFALCSTEYLNLRKSGTNIAGIKLEVFIGDISKGWDAVMAHCKLPNNLRLDANAEDVLKIDSHKGQIFSAESLKRLKYKPLTDDIIPEVDAIMDRFGLPRLHETCILDGTIGLTT